MSRATTALHALVEAHGRDDLPLAPALFALSLEEYPSLEPGPYEARLDALASRVRALTGRVGELQAVRQALFEEEGFAGNTEQYYERENSFLHEVMDRRLGLPITLSVLYVEVVRRAGGTAHGVGFPGHFLACHEIAGRAVMVDPFAGAQVRGEDELLQMLRRAAGPEADLQPWMMAPAHPVDVVTRVLVNLKHAYVLAEDLVGAVTALDRLLDLDPERAEERRDRGLLYGQLGLVPAAVADLEAYLAARPDAEDRPRVEGLLPRLRARRELMN